MTTKDERVRSIQYAGAFLLELARGEHKRVPKAARELARDRLRHYPTAFDLEQMLNDDYRRFIK